MANFPAFSLTGAGQDLLAKLHGGGELQFSRVAAGSGRMPPGGNVFSAVADGDTVVVTNSENGQAGAADGDTGFDVYIVIPGTQSASQQVGVKCLSADQIESGAYFLISSPRLDFHVWFRIDGHGHDPGPAGSIPVVVDIEGGNSAIAVASRVATVLDSHRLKIGDLRGLIYERQSLDIQSAGKVDSGVSEIYAILTNSGLEEGYYHCELGIFAMDPEKGEILYSVSNSGDQGDYFPAEGGAMLVEVELRLRTIVSDQAEVSMAFISQALASLAQLEEHASNPDAHPEMAQNMSENFTGYVDERIDHKDRIHPETAYRFVVVDGVAGLEEIE